VPIRARVAKTGSCHLFRHTIATLMLENGADIRYIQEMLGHAELTTTQIYTRVSIKQLQAVHALTHPAAKLDGARLVPEVSKDDDSCTRREQSERPELASVDELFFRLAAEDDEDVSAE